ALVVEGSPQPGKGIGGIGVGAVAEEVDRKGVIGLRELGGTYRTCVGDRLVLFTLQELLVAHGLEAGIVEQGAAVYGSGVSWEGARGGSGGAMGIALVEVVLGDNAVGIGLDNVRMAPEFGVLLMYQ